MNEKEETYLTRATLLQRITLERDEKSWEEFVLYYRDFLYLICCKMNMTHHEADDVVQQVLVKLWNKFPDFSYDESRRFRSWLCRIVQNCCRDYFRKVNLQHRLAEDIQQNDSEDFSLPDFEVIAEREWNDYLTTMALERIKEHFSEKSIAIFLRLTAGEKAADLEKEYDLRPNVIYVYRKRILDRLKDELRRLQQDLEG